MRIVKDFKDYKLTRGQQFFAGYLKEKLVDSGCGEDIMNPDLISLYLRPVNDFTIYTNAMPGSEAKRLVR